MFSSHFLKIISLSWAPLEVRLRTTLKCMCHLAHIFQRSYSSRVTRRLLVDNGCSSPELCNPIQYCLACRYLSIPPKVKMFQKTRCVTVAESLFLKNVSTANARCSSTQLKASNRSTQRCVFHRATYKDVYMALNLNCLIVSAPPCMNVMNKQLCCDMRPWKVVAAQ